MEAVLDISEHNIERDIFIRIICIYLLFGLFEEVNLEEQEIDISARADQHHAYQHETEP